MARASVISGTKPHFRLLSCGSLMWLRERLQMRPSMSRSFAIYFQEWTPSQTFGMSWFPTDYELNLGEIWSVASGVVPPYCGQIRNILNTYGDIPI